MNDNYFLWNGRDSREMGVIVDRYPVLTRPQERTEQVEVPGRQGALTFLEDEEPMYQTFVTTVQCFLARDADPGQAAAWLTGSGTLVLGCAPHRSLEARIINKIDYELLLRHRKMASFAIPFQCQPLRGQYPPPGAVTIAEQDAPEFDAETEYAIGDRARYDGANYRCTTAHTGAWNAEDFTPDHIGTIYNPGDTAARCVITVTAKSDSLYTLWVEVGDAEAGSGTLVTAQLPTGAGTPHGFVIDTDSAMVTDLSGQELYNAFTSLSANGMSGLYLPPRASTRVRWGDNVGAVQITPAWRWYL